MIAWRMPWTAGSKSNWCGGKVRRRGDGELAGGSGNHSVQRERNRLRVNGAGRRNGPAFLAAVPDVEAQCLQDAFLGLLDGLPETVDAGKIVAVGVVALALAFDGYGVAVKGSSWNQVYNEDERRVGGAVARRYRLSQAVGAGGEEFEEAALRPAQCERSPDRNHPVNSGLGIAEKNLEIAGGH